VTDLLHEGIERREAHPVPEWVERVCRDFGVMESGALKYRVIWNPDRTRMMNIFNPDTQSVVSRLIHKYPRIGDRWIIEALLPWELYGKWRDDAFGPKPPDGEYCHSHTIQGDLMQMMRCSWEEKTEYLSLDDFGQDNLRLLLSCIDKWRTVPAWQAHNYDEEALAREDQSFHEKFETVYDDNMGELRKLEQLSEKTGIRTSLDPLPRAIEAERRRKGRKKGQKLIQL
jgi:hypothetical protein